MRCMNCGLPLSPSRTTTNCPRCGTPLNALQGAHQQQQQFEQPSWEGSMGGAGQQQNLAGGSTSPGSYSPFPQQNRGGLNVNRASEAGSGLPQPLSPRRSYPPQTSKSNARLLFLVAGIFVFLGAMILGLVYILGSSNNGNAAQSTANATPDSRNSQAAATSASSTPTATSSTPDTTASPTGTVYPGQQYIDGAVMALGIDKQLQATSPTTTFKSGTTMYVVFNLHPPSQGGAFCAYWYQNGKQITQPYTYPVTVGSRKSFATAKYGQAGAGYVELYWASTQSCSGQVLAQHVDFTVTA